MELKQLLSATQLAALKDYSEDYKKKNTRQHFEKPKKWIKSWRFKKK